MKTSTLITTALTFALGAGAGALGVSAHDAHADPQPKMVTALEHLQLAQQKLENATPDKGGHRVAAIKLTKEAIVQVNKGIEYDNKDKDKK
ncbi:MAG: hypothetical protein ABI175_14820 [Polyangiales bacterium]